MKKLNQWGLAATLICGSITLTSCSGLIDAVFGTEDNPVTTDPVSETVVKAGSKDVLNGKMIFRINADSLDKYKIPVAAVKDLNITRLDESDTYGVEMKEIDGERYITYKLMKEPEPGIEGIRLYVEPKGKPERGRHCLLLFYKRPAEVAGTRSAETNLSRYSLECADALGKGTYIYDDPLVTRTKTIINHDRYKDISNVDPAKFDEYFTSNLSENIKVQSEKEYSTLEEMTYDWSVNIGISASAPLKGGGILSGGLNLDVNGSEYTQNSFEYYLMHYKYTKGFMKMQMSKFEKENNTNLANNMKYLLHAVDSDFVGQLALENLNTKKFVQDWGTDLITQISVGGLYYYIYSRKTNIYSTSVGYDAGLNISYQSNPQAGSDANQDWMKTLAKAIAKELGSSGNSGGGSSGGKQGNTSVSVNVDWSQNWSEYSQATEAHSLSIALGGDPSTTLEGWTGSLGENNLSVVSFKIPGESNEGDNSRLIPISDFAKMIYDGIEAIFKGRELTEDDQTVLNRMKANVDALPEARANLIDDNTIKQTDNGKLVIADFMVKKCGDLEPGMPKPFVSNDNVDKKYLVYYPIMASEYHPNSDYYGYGLDASCDDFIDATGDTNDQYFYYAVGHENDVNGIVDVLFESESWMKDDENGYLADYYYMRGDNSNPGVGDDDNYVWVKYASKKDKNRITAIGLCKQYDMDEQKEVNYEKAVVTNGEDFNPIRHLYGCTGGSELAYPCTPDQKNDWVDWWQNGNVYNMTGHAWHDSDNKGVNLFGAVYKYTELPIGRITWNTVQQPKGREEK